MTPHSEGPDIGYYDVLMMSNDYTQMCDDGYYLFLVITEEYFVFND